MVRYGLAAMVAQRVTWTSVGYQAAGQGCPVNGREIH